MIPVLGWAVVAFAFAYTLTAINPASVYLVRRDLVDSQDWNGRPGLPRRGSNVKIDNISRASYKVTLDQKLSWYGGVSIGKIGDQFLVIGVARDYFKGAIEMYTKRATGKVQMAVLYSSEDRLEKNRTIRPHLSVSATVTLNILEKIRELRFGNLRESVGFIMQIARLSASFFRVFCRSVVRLRPPFCHSDQSEYATRSYVGFAYLFTKSHVSMLKEVVATVSRNDNSVVRLIGQENYGGSKRGTSQAQCYKDPKYARRDDNLLVMFGPEAEDISYHDIDVSYDGKKWVHLFGPSCLKNEEPFANEIKRQCGQPHAAPMSGATRTIPNPPLVPLEPASVSAPR